MNLPRSTTDHGACDADTKLVGCWVRVEPHSDAEDLVEIQFSRGGELRYCVLTDNKWQIMKLTYRVNGSTLVTDQPSSPREESTRFALEADDVLVLEFGGQKSRYRRGQCVAPAVLQSVGADRER